MSIETDTDSRPFCQQGRKFPHNYEVYKDGSCSYRCGCRIGPYNAYRPDGVEPYGECPNHPDRPNIAKLTLTAMTCADENVRAAALREIADDQLRFHR